MVNSTLAPSFQTVCGFDLHHRADHEQLGLTFETRQPFGITGEDIRQDLDGDLSIQVRVLGAVDLSHAALTELFRDAVV